MNPLKSKSFLSSLRQSFHSEKLSFVTWVFAMRQSYFSFRIRNEFKKNIYSRIFFTLAFPKQIVHFAEYLDESFLY